MDAEAKGGEGPSRAFRIYRAATIILALLSLAYAATAGCLRGLARGFLIVLPALAANGAPVVASTGLRRLGLKLHPVDAGKLFLDGRRILGDGKTWEGGLAGVVAGLVVGVPVALYYSLPVWYGAVLGALALIGDLAGSFVKRRLGFPRGSCVIVLDQADFYLGALLAVYLLGLADYAPPACWALLGVVVAALHLATNYGAYRVGWKREEC